MNARPSYFDCETTDMGQMVQGTLHALWEPTQLTGDFRLGIALVICYSRHHDLPKAKDKDAPQSQMAISMTLAYVPEHWPLESFEESSHVINAVWAERDLVGMISQTQLHKKAPYLPDVSYREYGQHMTIAPLNLPGPISFSGLMPGSSCAVHYMTLLLGPFTASTPATERPVR